jgi:hypothetical protein
MKFSNFLPHQSAFIKENFVLKLGIRRSDKTQPIQMPAKYEPSDYVLAN